MSETIIVPSLERINGKPSNLLEFFQKPAEVSSGVNKKIKYIASPVKSWEQVRGFDEANKIELKNKKNEEPLSDFILDNLKEMVQIGVDIGAISEDSLKDITEKTSGLAIYSYLTFNTDKEGKTTVSFPEELTSERKKELISLVYRSVVDSKIGKKVGKKGGTSFLEEITQAINNNKVLRSKGSLGPAIVLQALGIAGIKAIDRSELNRRYSPEKLLLSRMQRLMTSSSVEETGYDGRDLKGEMKIYGRKKKAPAVGNNGAGEKVTIPKMKETAQIDLLVAQQLDVLISPQSLLEMRDLEIKARESINVEERHKINTELRKIKAKWRMAMLLAFDVTRTGIEEAPSLEKDFLRRFSQVEQEEIRTYSRIIKKRWEKLNNVGLLEANRLGAEELLVAEMDAIAKDVEELATAKREKKRENLSKKLSELILLRAKKNKSERPKVTNEINEVRRQIKELNEAERKAGKKKTGVEKNEAKESQRKQKLAIREYFSNILTEKNINLRENGGDYILRGEGLRAYLEKVLNSGKNGKLIVDKKYRGKILDLLYDRIINYRAIERKVGKMGFDPNKVKLNVFLNNGLKGVDLLYRRGLTKKADNIYRPIGEKSFKPYYDSRGGIHFSKLTSLRETERTTRMEQGRKSGNPKEKTTSPTPTPTTTASAEISGEKRTPPQRENLKEHLMELASAFEVLEDAEIESAPQLLKALSRERKILLDKDNSEIVIEEISFTPKQLKALGVLAQTETVTKQKLKFRIKKLVVDAGGEGDIGNLRGVMADAIKIVSSPDVPLTSSIRFGIEGPVDNITVNKKLSASITVDDFPKNVFSGEGASLMLSINGDKEINELIGERIMFHGEGEVYIEFTNKRTNSIKVVSVEMNKGDGHQVFTEKDGRYAFEKAKKNDNFSLNYEQGSTTPPNDENAGGLPEWLKDGSPRIGTDNTIGLENYFEIPSEGEKDLSDDEGKGVSKDQVIKSIATSIPGVTEAGVRYFISIVDKLLKKSISEKEVISLLFGTITKEGMVARETRGEKSILLRMGNKSVFGRYKGVALKNWVDGENTLGNLLSYFKKKINEKNYEDYKINYGVRGLAGVALEMIESYIRNNSVGQSSSNNLINRREREKLADLYFFFAGKFPSRVENKKMIPYSKKGYLLDKVYLILSDFQPENKREYETVKIKVNKTIITKIIDMINRGENEWVRRRISDETNEGEGVIMGYIKEHYKLNDQGQLVVTKDEAD